MYQVVPLAALVAGVRAGQAGLAAVTVDDGYRDCFECAFPILHSMAIPFTVFLPTGFLQTGQAGWAKSEYGTLPPLTWGQVREMQRHGADIGGHTHDHWRWSEQSSKTITRDLNISRRILEDNLDTPVFSFAYPYGQPHDIDRRGASLLFECGFRLAFTTLHTTLTSIPDPFRIPRICVNAEDAAGEFLQNLRGQRDILAPLQRTRSAWVVASRRTVPI
jgi:peptidoglycan/xylan/chitin deacetylase (PgdA/CDA1 family)